jgi:hypothetical protein
MPTQAADRDSLPAAHGRVSLVWENVGELTMDREIHEQIAQRAYALWQVEGQPDGRHEEHWYRATREIAAADSKNAAMKRTTRRKSRKT